MSDFSKQIPADQKRCDMILERAVEMMARDGNASPLVVIDRLLTYAAAQASSLNGAEAAADAFRLVADRIEAGALDSVTGERQAKH
ncbi:hypothetical protein N7I30_04475 [Aurantimonas litoralis]|nr:hypothetical protein [Aurantimonas litoralis]